MLRLVAVTAPIVLLSLWLGPVVAVAQEDPVDPKEPQEQPEDPAPDPDPDPDPEPEPEQEEPKGPITATVSDGNEVEVTAQLPDLPDRCRVFIELYFDETKLAQRTANVKAGEVRAVFNKRDRPFASGWYDVRVSCSVYGAKRMEWPSAT